MEGGLRAGRHLRRPPLLWGLPSRQGRLQHGAEGANPRPGVEGTEQRQHGSLPVHRRNRNPPTGVPTCVRHASARAAVGSQWEPKGGGPTLSPPVHLLRNGAFFLPVKGCAVRWFRTSEAVPQCICSEGVPPAPMEPPSQAAASWRPSIAARRHPRRSSAAPWLQQRTRRGRGANHPLAPPPNAAQKVHFQQFFELG